MEYYVTCPACQTDVSLPNHTVLGEIVKCPGCGVGIEILSLSPFIPDAAALEDWRETQYKIPGSQFLDPTAFRL
jgi:lysine biosynthesis protein LysW